MKNYIIPLLEPDLEIFLIEGMRKGKIPFTNAFLVKDHLFDTGISPIRLKFLKKRFSLRKVIFSHYHDDHIRDNKILNNLPHVCHEKERELIENIEIILHQYDLLGSKAEEMFRDYIKNVIRITGTRIDEVYKDGDLIKIGGGLTFEVIPTPGHSSGHCIFYNKQHKIAYLADIDLSEFGPWYGAKDCDILDFEKSIDIVKGIDLNVAVTGHSGLFEGSSLIRDRLDEYKKIIFKRDERILSYFKEHQAIKVNDLFKKNLIYYSYAGFGDFIPIMERTMIRKHFEKFLKRGTIEFNNGGYVLS